MGAVEPFSIVVGDDVLDDVRDRVARTRWAHDFANDDWRYGTNGGYLKELAKYWLDHYDWRVHERAMNAYPQFRTVIDSVPIHFLHVRGKGPSPMPLMLNHGWPWTFWDYRKLIGPLSDPVAHGGDAADAFDLIIPSLPGHGFSTPLTEPGINWEVTADLWAKLMELLGYARFATFGGDWGAFVSHQLGHKYAERLIGMHCTTMAPLDLLTGGTGGLPEDYADDEAAQMQRNQDFFPKEGGYFALQTTKPQTPAFALNDSPVGLAAWLVEKRRTWSDSRGNVERHFSKDDLLSTVMIYWVTESYGTSARYYYEAVHRPWRPAHGRMPVIEAPSALTVLPQEIVIQPRRWAERYYNLKQWRNHPEGGHFAPMEAPDAVIGDMRDFFRTLR